MQLSSLKADIWQNCPLTPGRGSEMSAELLAARHLLNRAAAALDKMRVFFQLQHVAHDHFLFKKKM